MFIIKFFQKADIFFANLHFSIQKIQEMCIQSPQILLNLGMKKTQNFTMISSLLDYLKIMNPKKFFATNF